VKGQTLGAAIKLIAFAMVTILATFVLAVVISNRTFGTTATYTAKFTDVTDLLAGNDVRLAGVRVGTVKSIKVVNGSNAEVSFTVDKSIPMTTSTHVDVRYLNLVGQRYLSLVEQPDNHASAQPVDQPIPTSRTSPALDLTALFNGFRPLFQALTPKDVNAFALELIKTLQGEGGTIDTLLTQTASLTNTIADHDAVIGQVVNNLLSVLSTVQQRDAGLSDTVVQLQRLVGGLAADRGTIAASLGNINNLTTSGTQLISGIRPFLPKDLFNLAHLTNNLNTTKDSDGKNTLASYLSRAPAKINRITRTATYGGYFNFWLCQLQITGLPIAVTPSASASPSCPAS
jgi:phospholipid/cholesterol/gamma-HCH transport system substrate-binding protein